MSSATVVVFPGQGSHPRELEGIVSGGAPDLAEILYELVGADVFARTETNPSCLQPALLAAMLAGWERLRRLVDDGRVTWGNGADGPLAFAGHSLGEIAALTAAGALSARDALAIGHLRGQLYEQAARELEPGRMLALIGEDALAFAGGDAAAGLWLANTNSPVQIVVAGPADAIERCRKAGRAAGLRVVPLAIPVAAHTPMLTSYVPRLRAALDAIELHETAAEVWSCTTGAPFDDVRAELAACIISPVRWVELQRALYARGARRFIDTGPGHVVAGLAHKTLGNVETPTVNDLESSCD